MNVAEELRETVVYGASDDLVEVEGQIRAEFYPTDDEESGYLGFSDGTVLRIVYTNTGVWRITPVRFNRELVTIEQAPEGDEHNYSDRAIIRGPVEWVVFGEQFQAVAV